MTSLPTDELKVLLEKAAPGDWHSEYDNSDTGSGQWFDLVDDLGRNLLRFSYNSSDEHCATCKANGDLAIQAPALAREVLDLRQQREQLIKDMRPGVIAGFIAAETELVVVRATSAEAERDQLRARLGEIIEHAEHASACTLLVNSEFCKHFDRIATIARGEA